MTKPRRKPKPKPRATRQTPRSRPLGKLPMKRFAQLSVTLLLLTACATAPQTSSVPLTKPIVECGEHAPDEPLADYPPVPDGMDLEGDPVDLDSAIYQLRLARGYIGQQQLWGIATAGSVQRIRIRRAATATCLDLLRKRGVIL